MKVLISGICGFVGTTIARTFREHNSSIDIVGFDNYSRPGSYLNRELLDALGVKVFHGDVRQQSDVASLPKCDWVLDAAANPSVLAGVDSTSTSRQLLENNLYGTVNLLEYAKRHQAGLILLSSSRVYSINALCSIPLIVDRDAFRLNVESLLPGTSPAGISEKFSTDAPISLYGSTKLCSEVLALEYSNTFDFPVRINRCGVLAGAGQFGRPDQGIFSFWLNSYLRRQPLKYIGFGGYGYQLRDCLHPRDLVPLLLKQMNSGRSSDPLICNLGGGMQNAMSLLELSNWCAERFGVHEVISQDSNRAFDIPWMVMDNNLAWNTWGWQPTSSLNSILEEIAIHAEEHPNWLKVSQA